MQKRVFTQPTIEEIQKRKKCMKRLHLLELIL